MRSACRARRTTLGLGNGTILTLKVNAGGTGYTNGDYVRADNGSGRIARGKITTSSGAITAISIPNGGGGAGFSANDAITVSGGSTTGSGATLVGHVNLSEQVLKYPADLAGGSGYTSGQSVTLTGVTSGRTAQASIFTFPTDSIYWLIISSSQTGFLQGERLIMSGNTTGSGVGVILADTVDEQGKLSQAGLYPAGLGYINGEAVTITGNSSGKKAQGSLQTNAEGVILSIDVLTSEAGFLAGEPLTISGTTAGTGMGPFTAAVGGPLASVEVVTGGTGYSDGNVVTFDTGLTPAQGVLHTTNGVITSVTVTAGGTGFSDGGLRLSPRAHVHLRRRDGHRC